MGAKDPDEDLLTRRRKKATRGGTKARKRRPWVGLVRGNAINGDRLAGIH